MCVQVSVYETDFPGVGKVGSRLLRGWGVSASPWVGVGLGLAENCPWTAGETGLPMRTGRGAPLFCGGLISR